MIRILVDCLGGDHSPDAQIEGSLLALKEQEDLQIVLFGDEKEIRQKLPTGEPVLERLEVVDAPEAITGEEKPTDAIRLKRDSSMMKAIRMLREDETAAALVSTGASGALVAAGTLRIGRLANVRRPAFCPVLPTMNGGLVGICDSGANVECTPEMLLQFAIMGSLYMKTVYHIESPRVALLNVGIESEKGDDLRRAAFSLLSETPSIHFVGNMESRDLLSGNYELVVCDGFSGNVLIKSTEGACLEMLKRLKKDIGSSFLYKIGALFMYRMFMKEKEFMNYQNYGGSVLLGTNKTIVKGHGSSKAKGVQMCIKQAYEMEKNQIRSELTKEILAAALPAKEE